MFFFVIFVNLIEDLVDINIVKQPIASNDNDIILLNLKVLTDRKVRIVSLIIFSGQLERKVKTMLLLFELKVQMILVILKPKNCESTVPNVASS